jgi:hypothetical protein
MIDDDRHTINRFLVKFGIYQALSPQAQPPEATTLPVLSQFTDQTPGLGASAATEATFWSNRLLGQTEINTASTVRRPDRPMR